MYWRSKRTYSNNALTAVALIDIVCFLEAVTSEFDLRVCRLFGAKGPTEPKDPR